MSKKEEIKFNNPYTISDIRDYLYKIKNWKEPLWKFHDINFNHLTYINDDTHVIKVKNTPEDIKKYPEVTAKPLIVTDVHKRTKYDVVGHVLNLIGSIPDIGFDFIEVTEYYHCGDLTAGIFIYSIEESSIAFHSGFNVSDVIVKIQRPEIYKILDDGQKICKTYEIKTIKDMENVINNIQQNENLIFTINRDGIEKEINMSIPFKTKIYQLIDKLKLV